MIEDKQYTQAELAQILANGLSPAMIDRWPLINLPEALAMVAQVGLAADPDDCFAQEDLESALRPRRGLRTPWGCIVAEFSASDDDSKLMVEVSGYLDRDPYIELPHLRRGAEIVGLFLSDIANSILEESAGQWLLDCELEWEENDTTSQLFQTLGFIDPTDTLAFASAGQKLGAWLAKLDIPDVLEECERPELLSLIDEDSGLPLSMNTYH